MNTTPQFRRTAMLGLVLLVMAALTAPAATRIWTGSSDNNWGTAGNWDGGASAPSDGDSLLFGTNSFTRTPAVNNSLTSVGGLVFTNLPSGGLVLSGNAISLGAGGITNGNPSASRDVIVSNAITLSTAQNWATINDVDAVVRLMGDLSGSGNVTLAGALQSNGANLPAFRLGGSNALYTGTIATAGSDSFGLLLLQPSAQPGGIVNVNSGNRNLWLTANSPGTPYTFGIGGSSGAIVQFRSTGTAGIYLTGGDVYWDPGNGGSYTWATTGTGAPVVGFNGDTNNCPVPRMWYFGNSGATLTVSGGDGTFYGANGGSYASRVTMLSALTDDAAAARTFSSSLNLLLLTRPAVNDANPLKLVLTGGSTAVTNMNLLPDGWLNLNGGVLILDNVSWSDFMADRSAGWHGSGANNAWGINSVNGGFAARGTPVTILVDTNTSASYGTITAGTVFNRDFTIGSTAKAGDGSLYANAAVTIAQPTVLSAARTWKVQGSNAESTTRWIVAGPVHEFSGQISGAYALTLGGGGTTAGGTVRLSNTNNSFSSLSVNPSGQAGGLAVLAPDDLVLGPGSPVTVGVGAQGQAGMLLFENQGGGTKDFSKGILIPMGADGSSGDSGFGSYAGNVRYNGTVTITGSKATLPVHVQAGTLSFGPGSAITNNSTGGTQTYGKSGAGELDLRGVTYAGSNGSVKWQLAEGGITISAAAQLGTITPTVDDLFSYGNSTLSLDRRLAVRDSSVALTFAAGGNFTSNMVVDVDGGLTLSTLMGANQLVSKEYGPNGSGFAWGMRKTGAGNWTYVSSYSGADYGRLDGYVKVDEGTFDVSGKMGRTALWLSGGTLLAGTNSPFTAGATGNRLRVDSDGGTIGISSNADTSVARSIAFDGTDNIWNLGGSGSLTLAARGNYSLQWALASFPDINAGETVRIERDSTGAGVVQLNDTAWTVAGTLGGSGTLKLGASGNGTNTLTGILRPGGSVGTLSVQGSVTMTAGTTNDFEFAAPGTCDRLAITGNLTLDGTLNVTTNPGFGPGSYTILTYSGTLTDNGLAVGSAPASYSYQVQAGGGQVVLNVLAPEIAVLGNGNAIASGDMTPAVSDDTDFGSISADGAGGAFADHVFTVTNQGSGTLYLSGSPAVALSGAAAFSVTVPPASTNVAGYGSVTFTVRFDPSAVGLATALVSIANNDQDETPYVFALQGTGAGGGPEIAVLGTNGAEIADGDASPAVADGTDFGTVAAGYRDQAFTITNAGSANLTLGGSPPVAVGGAHSNEFSVQSQPASLLLPGASTTFTLRFSPAGQGLRQATVIVANDDAGENPYDFAVQGTYAGPEIAVLGTNGAEIADGSAIPAAADGTDFGGIAVYNAAKSHTFAVTNSGGSTLQLSGSPAVQISGAHAADFTVTSQPSPTNVAVNAAVMFIVEFNPSAAGLRTATATLANNDANESSYDFALQGTGLIPTMSVLGTNGAAIADGEASPSAADGTDYGNAAAGDSVPRTFTITNSGAVNLVLTGTPAIGVTGGQASDFVAGAPAATTIPGGTSVTFTLTFTPGGLGLRQATVVITNTDTTATPYDFAVQGTGTAVTRTWNGNASTAWSAAGNWAENSAPVNGAVLAFTSGNPVNQPVNNDLSGLQVQQLQFLSSFTSPLTLAGNAVSLNAGISNAVGTAGRAVTVSNAITVAAAQSWVSTNANGTTTLRGDLGGNGAVTLTTPLMHAGGDGDLPVWRLGGSNAAYTGQVRFSNQRQGLALLNPNAMVGGNVSLGPGNVNGDRQYLYLLGSSADTPFTFGVGADAGEVQFNPNSNTTGGLLHDGNQWWRPAGGGDYTLDASTLNVEGRLNGSTGVLTVGTAGETLGLAGAYDSNVKTFKVDDTAIVDLRYALDDTAQSGKTFRKSGAGLLILNAAASGAQTTVNGVQTGPLSVSAMNQLFDGNLYLGDNNGNGIFLFNNLSWAAFTADRTGGNGTGGNQWRLGGGGSPGFAARGTAVTIDATQTTSATFDRDFTLGSALRWTNGSLYADAPVAVACDIALSASANRTWTFPGQNRENVAVVGVGANLPETWLVTGPVHEISGRISGGGASRQLTLKGSGTGGSSQGGTLRLSNPANDYAASNVLTTADNGGLVVIVTDDGALGDPANLVIQRSAGNGPDSLLLFEDTNGVGKTFGRSTILDTGDSSGSQSGIGSYAGLVTYTGTVSRVDANGPAETVLYAHTGSRLTLGSATLPAVYSNGNTRVVMSLEKQGLGEVVVSNMVHVNSGTQTQKWVLMEGTLVTTRDPAATANPLGGQLISGGPAQWNDICALGQQNANTTNSRTWAVRENDQTYTNMVGGSWAGQFAIDVAAGRTLRTYSAGGLAPQEGNGVNDTTAWDMVKTGLGTWLFWNGNTSFGYGRQNVVRVDQGTFDVTGDMGRGGLGLNGGTILCGVFSPFSSASGTQRLRIMSGGGKLGISTAATSHVSRADAITSWDSGSTSTVTLAARDDLNLVFASASFPDVQTNTTLLIDRDGSGTGVVQIADAAVTVNGTLGGSGTLKAGASGTGTWTVNGVVSPGAGAASTGTLTVQGNVALGAGAALSLNLGPIGGPDDKLMVNGNLTATAPITVNVIRDPGMAFGNHVIAEYTGTVSAAALESATVAGAVGSVRVDQPNKRVILTLRIEGSLLMLR